MAVMTKVEWTRPDVFPGERMIPPVMRGPTKSTWDSSKLVSKPSSSFLSSLIRPLMRGPTKTIWDSSKLVSKPSSLFLPSLRYLDTLKDSALM